jgi:ATP-dependent Clp protease ATP-binding subunit ClpB
MLEEYKMKVTITDDAINWLAEKGYDPQLGARPVKRLIQKEIINELSKEIIGGRVTKEDSIVIDADGDRLSFRHEAKYENVT